MPHCGSRIVIQHVLFTPKFQSTCKNTWASGYDELHIRTRGSETVCGLSKNNSLRPNSMPASADRVHYKFTLTYIVRDGAMGAFLSGRRSRPAVCSSQRSPGTEGERLGPQVTSVARVSESLAALRREISSSASALNLREMDRSVLDSYVGNLEILICETELLASRDLPGDSGAVFSPEKIRMLRDYLNDVKSYSCRTFSTTMSEQVMAHLDLLRSREMALKAGLPEGLSQKPGAQTGPGLQQIASGGAGLCRNEDETTTDVRQSRGVGKGPAVERQTAMNLSSARGDQVGDAPWETAQRQKEAGAKDLSEPLARPCSTCKANAALPGRDHGLCGACLAIACQSRVDKQQHRAGPSTPQPQPQPKIHQQVPTASITVSPLQVRYPSANENQQRLEAPSVDQSMGTLCPHPSLRPPLFPFLPPILTELAFHFPTKQRKYLMQLSS